MQFYLNSKFFLHLSARIGGVFSRATKVFVLYDINSDLK